MHRGLIRFPAICMILAALVGQGARADDASTPVAQPANMPVDDGALRYYAQQGQKERVAVELRHLQATHPGYIAPADLYKPASGDGSPEDQPLWDLFGAGKFDELKAGIAARMAEDSGWQAPADLVLKIRLKETRNKMLTLSGDGQWKKLIQIAKEDPAALDVGDIELMWALAESYAHAKQHPEALGIFTNILTNNNKMQERLATLQKSMAVLRMADVETLYELGHKNGDGSNEFDVILTDLTRARISAFLHDERRDDINADQVNKFADFAKAAPDPDQPGLLAWYHYKRREFAESLDWFKFALEKGGDAKIAHGLAHSLRQLRKFREAEEVAYAWRDYDVANKLLFIDLLEMDLTKQVPPYIEDERLARYGRLAMDDASGEGAQALAWYAYNSCQYFTALEWFQRANAWFPKEATAYGLALTYRRLGDRKNFIETVNRYDGLFPKVVALVFPDDHYSPPTPCEETVLAPQSPMARQPNRQVPGAVGNGAQALGPTGLGLQQAGEQTLTGNGAEISMPNPMTDPTIAYPPGMAPNYLGSIHDPMWRYSWGRVPSPSGQPFRALAPNYHGEPWAPASFNPNEFPVMVDPQNPLRFLASGAPTANPAPAATLVAAVQGVQAPEPLLPPWPMLARKVPGVLPMPYETNGFTLQYVNVPDPRKKGAMIQVLRFVPPAGFGASFNNAWNQPAQMRPQPMPAMQQTFQPMPQMQPIIPVPQAPPIVQFGPQSRLQPVSMQTTGTIMQPQIAPAQQALVAPQPAYTPPAYSPPAYPPRVQPQPVYAAPVPPTAQALPQVYAPPPGNLLPPGYQPLVIPQQPGFAPMGAYVPASAYAPAPANAPQQPVYAQQPEAPEPLAVPANRPARVNHRAIARPQATRAAPVAVASGSGCGAGGSSAKAALDQGWCLLNAQRPQEAALLFDRAITAGLGKVREDAAYGKSLAELRSNLTDSAVQAANSASLSPQRRNEIGVAVLAQRAQGFYNQGDYRSALTALDQRMAHAAETRDLSMMRGWILFHLDKIEEAERLFTALDRQTTTKESRQGLGAVDARMAGRNR